MADGRIDVVAPDDLVPHSEWAPTRTATRCATCTRLFSIFRRKNHCHTCGEVVCKTCIMEMPVTGQSILVYVCMRCSLRRRQSAPSPEGAYDNAAALLATASSKALLPRGSIDTIHETTDFDSNRDGSLFAFQLAVASPGHEQPATDHPTWVLRPDELAPYLVPILGRFRCDHCRHVLVFRHRVNCRACGDVVCRRCVIPTIVQEHGQNDRTEIAVCATCDEIHKALGSYKECRTLKRALGPSAYPPGVHVGAIDAGETSRKAFARKVAHFKALEEAKLVPEDIMCRRDAAWSPSARQATCPRCDRLVSWRSAGCCCMCGRAFCNTCVWRRFARSPGRYELDQVLVCSNCLLNFERENRVRRAYLLADCVHIYLTACGVDADGSETPVETTAASRNLGGDHLGGGEPTTKSCDMDEARLEALLVQTIERNLKLSHSIRSTMHGYVESDT